MAFLYHYLFFFATCLLLQLQEPRYSANENNKVETKWHSCTIICSFLLPACYYNSNNPEAALLLVLLDPLFANKHRRQLHLSSIEVQR
jgi:hypothetical protein